MFYDVAKQDHGLPNDPFKALVTPRPIGWVSTVDVQGRVNLAPFSFFNGVSDSPPMVMYCPGGSYGNSPAKHSLINAKETGEFVVNIVSEALKDAMNATAAQVEMGIDEMELAGLAPAACNFVKPPRVAKSPVALECKVWRIIDDLPGSGVMRPYAIVIGSVVGIHIDDAILKDGRVDALAYKPIARLGYSEYSTVDNVWRMRRPE